jgi:hypothetical protein
VCEILVQLLWLFLVVEKAHGPPQSISKVAKYLEPEKPVEKHPSQH